MQLLELNFVFIESFENHTLFENRHFLVTFNLNNWEQDFTNYFRYPHFYHNFNRLIFFIAAINAGMNSKFLVRSYKLKNVVDVLTTPTLSLLVLKI